MTIRPIALALLALLAVAGPVGAATAPGALFGGYWGGFLDHWSGVFQKQNGIVMAALLLGAICLLIITRGKWRQ